MDLISKHTNNPLPVLCIKLYGDRHYYVDYTISDNVKYESSFPYRVQGEQIIVDEGTNEVYYHKRTYYIFTEDEVADAESVTLNTFNCLKHLSGASTG